jgi:predicted nucleotidyltransferase
MPALPADQHLPVAAREALAALLRRQDPTIVGLVLTGSAARGLATENSDADVIVVRDEAAAGLRVIREEAIDEIPMTLAEIETVLPIGSSGAWIRWQFAWAKVLRDNTDGRIAAAIQRQAILAPEEQTHVLTGLGRLDEFINFAYRSLKSHRDKRPLQARLDSAESVAPFLDVIFAFEARVRPYNKYLPWELREHPLSNSRWQAAALADLLQGLLDGSPDAVRDAFLAVEDASQSFDEQTGTTDLTDIIEAWEPASLALLRGR